MANTPKKRINEDYLRSMIFGIEDALVSTTGVIAGISAGSNERSFIILAGVVTVAVEALSMGAGQYLSEKAVHEMDGKNEHNDSVILTAVIMFVSYAVAGAIPVMPFLFSTSSYATVVSVAFALIGLYLLGYIKGKYLHISAHKSALEMFAVGGIAAIVGLIVGKILQV